MEESRDDNRRYRGDRCAESHSKQTGCGENTPQAIPAYQLASEAAVQQPASKLPLWQTAPAETVSIGKPATIYATAPQLAAAQQQNAIQFQPRLQLKLFTEKCLWLRGLFRRHLQSQLLSPPYLLSQRMCRLHCMPPQLESVAAGMSTVEKVSERQQQSGLD